MYKSVFIEMNYIPILCANLEKGFCIQEGFDAELIDFYTLLSPCVAGEHSRNKFPVIVRHLKKVLSNPLTSLIVTPRQLVDEGLADFLDMLDLRFWESFAES